MQLTSYGTTTAIKSVAIVVLLAGSAFALLDPLWLRVLAAGVGTGAAWLVLNFFRDPDRTTPTGEKIVVSPADGKVVVIKEFFESEYLHEEAIQVSIFMSPLNVHVNRFPISGTVGFFRHIEGKYLVAFNEKSSDLNERTLIGVEHPGYKVLFKQIAGAAARRIVAPVVAGQAATRGERFGMIKFGSRVDVIMPKRSRLAVALNEHVVAGETILASYS